MISILTATYNRINLLTNLYKSIKDNYKTFSNFEWIIIDDGSNDNTKEVVSSWIKESSFKIIYKYQENQGKMQAINNAIKLVKGNIIIEVDNDDTLTKNILSKIESDYKKYENENIYGIIYKTKITDKENQDLSNLNNNKVKLFELHNKYGYDFDMKLTFKTEVRKKYLYELEKNEKFITEARLYYKLDNLYDGAIFIDEYAIESTYHDDGYSKNINTIFKKYPNGYYEYFNECLSYINKDTLKSRKMYFIKHYILFSYLTKKSILKCIKNAKSHKLLITLLVIPGYIKSKRF